MAWTYNSTAIGSSGLSWVRWRVGDTDTDDQLLDDDEIQAAIDNEGNKELGAAVTAEVLGAHFARKVDKSVGKLRLAMAQASEHYFTLADRLRTEVNMRATAYAGGISESDRSAEEADTDRVNPAFFTGQFDHPGAPTAASTNVF